MPIEEGSRPTDILESIRRGSGRESRMHCTKED